METKTQSKLDLLLLKALGLESEVLTPTQSVEDALEAFFKGEFLRDWGSQVSFDKVPEIKDELFTKEYIWEVGIRGMLFQEKELKLCLTKALLWAVTEFTTEEVEQLFKRKETDNG